MLGDRKFKIAFTISIIAHIALFIKISGINPFRLPRPEKEAEVTYIKEKVKLPSLKAYHTQKLSKGSSYKIASKGVTPAPYVPKESFFQNTSGLPLKKPDLAKIDIVKVKKDVSLPRLTDEKMSSPVYLNYYEMVREQIRHAAYKNYTRTVNGEVSLSFILWNNGQLKEMRIGEKTALKNPYLRDVAIRSIKQASPFPHFPKELDYPQLSFNVIISFQTE